MLKIWIATFAKEFYKQHAGLLLIIFYVLFGWVKSGEIFPYIHSILLTLCSSPVATSGLCIILFLYALKGLVFISQKLAAPTYTFINISCSAEKKDQMKNWLGLYCIILFPPLFITLLVLLTGLYYGYYWCVVVLCIYVAILLRGLVQYTFRKVNYAFKPSLQFSISSIDIRKPYWTWSIHYVLNKQALMFIICKVLSFILFTGIIWMFADSGQDIRIYLIALLAAIIAHSTMIAACWRFEKSSLGFLKSLPVSCWSRLSNTILSLLILFIPELIIFMSKAPLSLYSTAIAVMFSISGLLTLKMALYLLGDHMESYLKFIFIFFLITIFAILTQQFIALSLLLISCNSCYYRYLFYKSKL